MGCSKSILQADCSQACCNKVMVFGSSERVLLLSQRVSHQKSRRRSRPRVCVRFTETLWPVCFHSPSLPQPFHQSKPQGLFERASSTRARPPARVHARTSACTQAGTHVRMRSTPMPTPRTQTHTHHTQTHTPTRPDAHTPTCPHAHTGRDRRTLVIVHASLRHGSSVVAQDAEYGTSEKLRNPKSQVPGPRGHSSEFVDSITGEPLMVGLCSGSQSLMDGRAQPGFARRRMLC